MSRTIERKLYKFRHPEWLRANRTEYQRKWRERNPEKLAAHKAVSVALSKGVLRRPRVCSRCNEPCKPHAHHADYSKPLQVEWLCWDCHNVEHGNARIGPKVSPAELYDIVEQGQTA